MGNSKPRGRGFTLIELLVVISIISLLATILIPSLAEAQWMTKMAMCQSNLHQTGVAVGAYQSSYGMDHPFIFHGGTGDGSAESSLNRNPANAPGNPAEAMLKDGHEKFLDDAEVFFCPCAQETYENDYNIYGSAARPGCIWGTYGWLYPHVGPLDDPFHPDDHNNGRRYVGPNSKDLLMRDYRSGYYNHANGLFLDGHASLITREYSYLCYYLYGDSSRTWYL